MRPQLEALASSQGGIFSRAQALHAGYTDREIKALTRPIGDWVQVRTGHYAVRIHVDAMDDRERWILKDLAALMMCKRPAVMSHDSAARWLEINTLEPAVRGTHLTLYGPHGSRSNTGITRHRDVLPLCVELNGGALCTSYARTAIDIGRLHGYLHGLVAVDSVRNKGVPLADLEAELDRMSRHPHIARSQAAVRDSVAGAESPLETLGRDLVKSLGLGEVEAQFAVGISGGRVVYADLRVNNHLFECQGLVKLVPVEDGGFAKEPARRVLRRQRGRQTEMTRQGFGMSEIYWEDCFEPRREEARRRLLSEYAVTERAFGRKLPEHLRRFADEHPRRRPSGLWAPGGLGSAA